MSLQTVDNHQAWPVLPLSTGVASATHKTRILCIYCQNSLHHDWFISSAASDSHDCFFTFDNSPQQALFWIYMLLRAILCFIITSQHDAKWPRKSVCMRMLSPVSLKWYNVTKTILFPIVLNFHHLFKGGVTSLLYNVVVALCGKLKAIHVSLNLLVCIKHPYSIELTHLCCQKHFKLSPPSHALIVITSRKGKLLSHSIHQDIVCEFLCCLCLKTLSL